MSSAAASQPLLRGSEKSRGTARLPEDYHPEQPLPPSGRVAEASQESGSGEGAPQHQEDDDEEEEEGGGSNNSAGNDNHEKCQRGLQPRPPPPHVAEAPLPKENPWTRWKPPPASGSSLSPSSASAGSELAPQDSGEQAKVVGKPWSVALISS